MEITIYPKGGMPRQQSLSQWLYSRFREDPGIALANLLEHLVEADVLSLSDLYRVMEVTENIEEKTNKLDNANQEAADTAKSTQDESALGSAVA